MKRRLIVGTAIAAVAAIALWGCGKDNGSFPISDAGTSITFQNLPSNAQVYIDNNLKAPVNGRYLVDPGDHGVQIQLMGYTQTSPNPAGDVTVQKGQTLSVEVALERLTPPNLPAL